MGSVSEDFADQIDPGDSVRRAIKSGGEYDGVLGVHALDSVLAQRRSLVGALRIPERYGIGADPSG
jgi:hypothetical protein